MHIEIVPQISASGEGSVAYRLEGKSLYRPTFNNLKDALIAYDAFVSGEIYSKVSSQEGSYDTVSKLVLAGIKGELDSPNRYSNVIVMTEWYSHNSYSGFEVYNGSRRVSKWSVNRDSYYVTVVE